MKLAKRRISELQHFVDLTESYVTDSFQTYVIKEYANTGSIKEVVDRMNKLGFKNGERSIESSDITAIINSNPSKKDDELHRIVRKFYRKKIKRNY